MYPSFYAKNKENNMEENKNKCTTSENSDDENQEQFDEDEQTGRGINRQKKGDHILLKDLEEISHFENSSHPQKVISFIAF